MKEGLEFVMGEIILLLMFGASFILLVFILSAPNDIDYYSHIECRDGTQHKYVFHYSTPDGRVAYRCALCGYIIWANSKDEIPWFVSVSNDDLGIPEPLISPTEEASRIARDMF